MPAHLDEAADGLAVCGHDVLLVGVHDAVALSTPVLVLLRARGEGELVMCECKNEFWSKAYESCVVTRPGPFFVGTQSNPRKRVLLSFQINTLLKHQATHLRQVQVDPVAVTQSAQCASCPDNNTPHTHKHTTHSITHNTHNTHDYTHLRQVQVDLVAVKVGVEGGAV